MVTCKRYISETKSEKQKQKVQACQWEGQSLHEPSNSRQGFATAGMSSGWVGEGMERVKQGGVA